MLSVSTINVNGMRAAAKKGLIEWLAATEADVVCLQEIRAEPEQLPDELFDPEGWGTVVYVPGKYRGRNGVSIFSRTRAAGLRHGFGSTEFDESGRYVEMDLPGLVIGSLYLPSGEVGTSRQAEKERFMAEFLPYLAALKEKAAAEDREVLICGDWNIAHQQVDLKNWKTNQRNAGFLPEERAWLGKVFTEAGYVDVVRALHPDAIGPYTWWSYRGKAFDNDAGWRIDHHIATPGLAARARTAVVERAASYERRWSDHAPVTVQYEN